MKIHIVEDEAWPVLVEHGGGQEFDVDDALVIEWRLARDSYWRLNERLLDLTSRRDER